MAFIYSLTHPSSSRIYIGKTTRDLKRRLYGHMDESRRGRKTRKNSWIKSLVKKNFIPEIKVIAEVSDEQLNEKETYYIKLAKQVAPNDILNSPLMPGGEGFSKGKNISSSSRKKSAFNRRVFTNGQLQAIASRINNGEYIKDIAKEFGVHRFTLVRNLNGKTTNSHKISYSSNRASGTIHHNSKITKAIASEIRKLWSTGEYHQKDISDKFKLTQANVWSIIQNKTWRDESYTVPKVHTRGNLTEQQRLEVLHKIKSGTSVKDLLREYPISKTQLYRIKSNNKEVEK